MQMRGVKQEGCHTKTSYFSGDFNNASPRKEFFDILADEGLFQIRTTRDLITDRFIEGIKLVDDWKILIYA